MLARTIHAHLEMTINSTQDRRDAGLVDMEAAMDTFDDFCSDDFSGASVEIITDPDAEAEGTIADLELITANGKKYLITVSTTE
jgi:hypothetical protein